MPTTVARYFITVFVVIIPMSHFIPLAYAYGAEHESRHTVTVDINHANAEQLITLPGIGLMKARAIVRERESNGPFLDIEDLERVEGIGASTIRKLETHLDFSSSNDHLQTN